jgi:hypothetical protein
VLRLGKMASDPALAKWPDAGFQHALRKERRSILGVFGFLSAGCRGCFFTNSPIDE